MGDFFIRFVVFTSTLVYSAAWNQSLVLNSLERHNLMTMDYLMKKMVELMEYSQLYIVSHLLYHHYLLPMEVFIKEMV